MAEKVNLQQKIQQYRQANPKLQNLSDEKILSIMVQNGVISLTEDEQRSVFGNNKPQNNNMGLQVEKTAKKTNPQKTIYLQSGRKVVYSKTANGKIVMRYYGTDGTQLNPDYFKKVEGQISISEDGKTYTITKDGKKTTLQAKDPSKGAIDQNLARLNNEEKRLKKIKKGQGFIGSSWDWIKNTTEIGDGSDKSQKQIEAERKLLNQVKTGKISKKDFKEVTGVEYSQENLEKFKRGELSQVTAKIDGYKEGQEMASDVAGDMISGIAAVGIYTAAVAAAPFTGGASIAVGVAAATASGALIKAGVKALDTVGTDRKYTLKDFGHDSLTGGFSGLLAPITGGMGGAVGKTVATKLGIQAVKQVGKEVAEEAVEQGVKQGLKQGLKTALTNPTGYEYVGGTLVKRGTALAAEMATDGALGGAIDGGFRAGLDNDWDANAILSGTVEGGIGGAIMAPIIGGGMKAAGKGAQKIFGKNNVEIDANGNRVRANDDGTVVKIDENVNEVQTIANNKNSLIPNGSSKLIDEFNNFKLKLKEDGENFNPQFENPNSPIAKYYNSLLEALNKRIKHYEETINKGGKYFGGKPTGIGKPSLEHFQSYLLLNSHDIDISAEDYWQIVKEVNKNVVENIKRNPSSLRKEYIDNAEKIQEWASIFATQNPKTGNSKFYDEKMFNQAVKEYTEFVENITGKKLLIGCPSRMNFPISALGLLNDVNAYKDVDYILLGHGKGSSLITDTTNPNTWRFSDNDLSIYEYIEQNVPKGKKVLVFCCEVDGLKHANKTREEMVDRAGNKMLGIGSPVSAHFEESGSVKIVKSGTRHIIGQVYSKGTTITELGNTPVLDNNPGYITIANQVEKLYYDLDFEPFKVENIFTHRELVSIDNILSKFQPIREKNVVRQLLTKETLPIVEKFVNTKDTAPSELLRFLDVIKRRGYDSTTLEKFMPEQYIITDKLINTLEFKNFDKFKNITLENFSTLSLDERKEFINAFISVHYSQGHLKNLPDIAMFEKIKGLKKPNMPSTMASKSEKIEYISMINEYKNKVDNFYSETLNKMLETISRTKSDIPQSVQGLNTNTILAKKPALTTNISNIPTENVTIGSHRIKVGLIKEDGTYFIHNLTDENIPKLEAYLLTEPDAILCTGYIGGKGIIKDSGVKPGIIVSPKNSMEDLLITAKEDVSSGYGAKKNYFNVQNMFLQEDNTANNYIPKLLKEKLNISTEEYNLRLNKLKNITHLDDIEAIDKELYDAIKTVIDENPIFESIMRPKVEAIYLTKGMKISENIASFAERYDIPILFKDAADMPATQKPYVKPAIEQKSIVPKEDLMASVVQTTKLVTREEFEQKLPILKEQNLIEYIEEEFKKAYPNRDIRELYSLTAFDYAMFDKSPSQNRAYLRWFIKYIDNLTDFPFEKYQSFLKDVNAGTIAGLSFNEGITPEILDKYSVYLTKQNFPTVLKNLNKENISLLDKYIAEGKITPENISKLAKFNTKFDTMLTEYFGGKVDNKLFENLIKLDIRDEHYNYIELFKNYVDKDNIMEILKEGYFSFPKEKINIPEELLGTLITKENFIRVHRSLGQIVNLGLEKNKYFKNIDWNKYRNYVLAHSRDGVSDDVLELMNKNIEPKVLNILTSTWPATDHGGEEADFAKYITNMSKMKEWSLVEKLELHEQCNQPLMIEYAKKDPFVENLFNQFKSNLESELLHPVSIIETSKVAKNNFMQLISNNPLKSQKLENLSIQEIKEVIYAELPEIKTLTKDDSFAKLLQDIVKAPEFSSLDDESKFGIKLAAILSTIKPEHANALMEKLNLQYGTRRYVLDLLSATQRFSFNKSRLVDINHLLATQFPTEDKLNAAKLFSRIKDGYILPEETEKMVKFAQSQLYKTGIPAFSTRLPKGQNLDKIPTVSYNGKEYQVLNLLEEQGDLSAFGFVPGTTLNNFSINATFVRDVNEANTMFLSGNPIISGIPSTSKIGLGQNASFQERLFAVLVEDVNKADYIFANMQDTDIGHGVKNIYVASQKMFNTLGESNGLNHRIYMANLLKERLGLTHEQYGELYKQIINKKYISQIKSLKIDGQEVSSQRLAEIKTALEDIQKDLVSQKFYKGNHNETNLSRPEVNQDFILAKVNDISEIPQEWLDFAEKNHKKFILIGNSQENGVRFTRSADLRKTQVYDDIIPEIKYSDSDLKAIYDKLNTFNQVCQKEEISLYLDGVEEKATRFLNTQQGSNQAYYTQVGNKLYYIKYCGNDNGQCIEEVMASKLYRLAGIDSPNTKYVYDKNNNIIGMASEYIPNISMKPERTADIYDGYAVDAWLANWDAPKNDNTQFRKSGVVKVDVGGSLRHRAKGEVKEFGLTVPELSSLIENNPQYMQMTKDDLVKSLNHIVDIPESAILKIVADSPLDNMQMADILIQRQNYIKLFKQQLELLNEKDFNNILELVKQVEKNVVSLDKK